MKTTVVTCGLVACAAIAGCAWLITHGHPYFGAGVLLIGMCWRVEASIELHD